ncbi:unnamed protein product [Blepharisma stoltei]|uniref:acetyl-CoA C-acetyltransferase n=1 Tax=Blepharisma stoltei TaxID=1481888 RepID=A0AAU9IYF2_9CILI|nr:unnamed protein product [Blepharisma stoltei]
MLGKFVRNFSFLPRDVVIVGAKRTAIGSFGGCFSAFPAPVLGSFAIRSVFLESKVSEKEVQEVIMGHVFQGGAGQSSTRQAAILSGLPNTTCATGVNKLCASGLKAVTLAVQNIALGHSDVIIAGGMESMSSVPYILQKYRTGHQYSDNSIQDLMSLDGLNCPYNKLSMGACAEITAEKFGITREEQDKFCIRSYTKANKAWNRGFYNKEIVKVVVGGNKGQKIISNDEEYTKVKYDKIPTLKPVFSEKGTITAANASSINDGAAAVLLMSKEKADKLGLKPLARILSFADSETEPLHFSIAPAEAMQKCLTRAGLSKERIDLFEINEAFSSVVLANIKLLDIDLAKVNINGGAVALGHPVGMSGARILGTLLYSLQEKGKTLGLAGICNGGGGATSILIESL